MAISGFSTPAAETPSPAGPARPAGGRPRLLLVEDHADLACTTAHLLGREGFDVEIAPTAGLAIEAARRARPDVLLCDLNLPDMSGLELVARLAPELRAGRTHVILASACSGRELDEHRRRAAELGVGRVVAKPVVPAQVRRLFEDTAAAAEDEPAKE